MEYATDQSMTKQEKIAGIVIAAMLLAIVAFAVIR